MTSLALILLVAAAGHGVGRALGLPVTPLLLLAGLGLAWSGALPESEAGLRRGAFELGLAFLVFTAGMELNPQRFARQLRAVLWVGLGQFTVAAAAGYGIARWLGFPATTAVYLGLALSTSSTLVVVGHLKQQQQMFEPYARLVIGVLLVQDLLIILIIAVMSGWESGGWPALRNLSGVLGLGALAVAGQRWVLPWLLVRRALDEESLLLMVLALLFGFGALAWLLGVPLVAGAFLAGFALARFPVNGVVRGLLLSLSDFFQAIFFTGVGTLLVMPSAVLLGKGLLLAVGVLIVTPPLVALLAEWQGFTARQALESGLLLAQTSEFALVLGLMGSQVLNQLPETAFAVIALVTILTMTVTSFVATDRFTTFLLRFHPWRRRPGSTPASRQHVLMLGFGAGGRWVLKPLQKAGYEVVVVDDDPQVIEKLQASGVACLRGDGSDEGVLEQAGARQARLVLASMRRVRDGLRVLDHVHGVPVVVRVFEEAEADAVRRRGGIAVLNSEAAAETFLDWFEKTLQAPPSSPVSG